MFTAFARTIILYLLLIFGIRLMGKRQVGELEPSELVLSLLIADLASVPMQDLGAPLHTGVIPILTLLSLTMLLSVLTVKSLSFRTLLCGRPSVVIRNGKLDQRELSRNRLTVDELLEELRGQGYPDLNEIGWAVLETNGQLSILPRSGQSPDPGLPLIVISDGRVLAHNLRTLGRDERWLSSTLAEQGLSRAEQVFLMTCDRAGGVFVSEKEESP